jgi:hypothetical protein
MDDSDEPSQVERQLVLLHDNLGTLEHKLRLLGDTLGPVLTTATESDGGPCDKEDSLVLRAEDIRSARYKVEFLTDVVTDLLSRLEV